MKNYRTIIRQMLGELGKYKLPEDTLRAQLASQLDGEVNDVQLQQDLKWLLDKAWIDYKVRAGERGQNSGSSPTKGENGE